LDHLVGQRLRLEAAGGGRLLHLEAVLVGAGQKAGVVADRAVKAGERVGHDGGVGVAEVGDVVHVVDGSCDVEAAHDDPGSRGRPGGGCGGNMGLTSPAWNTCTSPCTSETRTRWRRTSTSTTRPSPASVMTRLPSLGSPLRSSA